MTQASSKSNLTPAKQSLIGLMQRINFGCIQGLVVRDGEPVLEPRPRVVREVKFCSENGPRPEAAKQDFTLKKEVRDLFAQIEALGSGTILSLEVKHGLPFKMSFEEDAA
ncbi:MAG: hypothetical protein M0009_15780 [Deltaproteobacteria bacterium]|nr:hypothetical protein [Deltaproteobacteria bacterium]